jgi:hypothetical protein
MLFQLKLLYKVKQDMYMIMNSQEVNKPEASIRIGFVELFCQSDHGTFKMWVSGYLGVLAGIRKGYLLKTILKENPI